MNCQFYKNTADTKGVEIPVKSILGGIKKGRWKDEILALRAGHGNKFNLPAAAFSGTFSKRKDSGLLKYTHLVVIDVDKKDIEDQENAEDIVSTVKEWTIEDPFVFASFYSPSGGLKIVYKVHSNQDYHSKFAYTELSEFVQDNYDVPVDRSGKNISRLCYISFDPGLYYNPNCLVFTINTAPKPPKIKRASHNTELSTDTTEIASVCCKFASMHFSRTEGQRNSFAHAYACNMKEAGILEGDAVDILLMDPVSLDDEEIMSTVKGVYGRESVVFGSKPIYTNKKSVSLFSDEE